jgi:hypothetical protein
MRRTKTILRKVVKVLSASSRADLKDRTHTLLNARKALVAKSDIIKKTVEYTEKRDGSSSIKDNSARLLTEKAMEMGRKHHSGLV